MTRTAFYGGSFDPPHFGHLGVAGGALASGRTDRVLFAPAFHPPHKPERQRAPFADRVAMLRLAIDGKPGLDITDIEERLKLVPSYTVDVLAALAAELATPVQLLIGGDSLRDLHTWHRARELVEAHEILTYPRPGETPAMAELMRNWPPELAKKLYAGILPGRFFEISSTNIRNSMAKLPVHIHINREVPKSVEEYIRKNNLYSRGVQGGKT